MGSPSFKSTSGSMILNSSRQIFHICVSRARMSMIAVENCCNACSSAAAASGDAASVGRLGVAARDSDAGEPGICPTLDASEDARECRNVVNNAPSPVSLLRQRRLP